ncbi:MAG: hypothetical protein H6625_01200 [Bdellovibrionaceae bacterium]|nr:hypothetical protein [Pseudobdellovibrionaceae bacterium]
MKKPILRWSFIVFLSLFFITLLMQFIFWKQYSLEATYVQLKNIFLKETTSNYLELGAICNSLEDTQCAKKYFSHIIEREPNNKLALANLAMVLTKQKNWKDAEPLFKAYFTLGGESYDVFYWFGLTEKAIHGVESGMYWVLHSLKINPDYLLAGEEIVNHYLAQNNLPLSLSIIGSLTRGHPENYKYWNSFLNRKEFIDDIDDENPGKVNWELVSLDGLNYYLPLVLRKNTRIKFFSVFNYVESNLISTDTLNELLIPSQNIKEKKIIKFNERSLSVYPVFFPEIYVAGKKIEDVVFYTCKSCPNVIGSKFLDKYELQYWTENKIDFLKISSK